MRAAGGLRRRWPPRYRATYLGLLKDLCQAHPGCGETIAALNVHVSTGTLYKALKRAQEADQAPRPN